MRSERRDKPWDVYVFTLLSNYLLYCRFFWGDLSWAHSLGVYICMSASRRRGLEELLLGLVGELFLLQSTQGFFSKV